MIESLTPRELDVVRLTALGYSNNEIASELHITSQTARNYVLGVCNKLGVKGRVRVTLWAIGEGIVVPSRQQSEKKSAG